MAARRQRYFQHCTQPREEEGRGSHPKLHFILGKNHFPSSRVLPQRLGLGYMATAELLLMGELNGHGCLRSVMIQPRLEGSRGPRNLGR